MFDKKKIVVEEHEFFDSNSNKIICYPKITLTFEHSLYTISKWECLYGYSYFDTFGYNLRQVENTAILFYNYIKCMCIDKNIDDIYINFLTEEDFNSISKFINNKMSATRISDRKKPALDIITSEEIYGKMCALNIPFECEHWHINRLLMLIRVCSEMSKEQKPKKRTSIDINAQMRLNESRKEKHNTSG